MAKEEIAISIRNIHKDFILPQNKNTSLKQAAVNIVRKNNKTTQKVLDGVSFDIHKGDFFGIVGRNGSGKSTLLKLIAGVYVPTSGEIIVNGGLTPFIELGVGFNPELSGRDNVYLNGALLGYDRKQMDSMYDEIVDFAELGPFMDQKLKNYSSGMQVRLAFSIAIKAKNDILIFDEVLAVGDEAFQRKCNDYFNEIKKDKSQTVVLVTHSMDAVKRYCNKALLIKNGKVVAHGDPSSIANEYSLENIDGAEKTEGDDNELSDTGVSNIKVKLLSNKIINEKDEIKFYIEYDVTRDIDTVVAFSITDKDRNVWLYNDNLWENVFRGAGHYKMTYSCNLSKYISNSVVDIRVSVWTDKEEVLGFAQGKNIPTVIIRRGDIEDKRSEGISTGLIYTKGEWEVF